MKLARRAALYIVVALASAYAVDWSAFQISRARGGGMGSVDVDRYLKTPLKGRKNEYDYLGTTTQACARSLFPQYAGSAWNPPCWWLMRHKTVWVESQVRVGRTSTGLRPTSTSARRLHIHS